MQIQMWNEISKYKTGISLYIFSIFHYSDVELADIPLETLKRSLGISSGSRRVRADPFAFGLGKRADPFAFGLGRRKRFYWKSNPFNFLKEEGTKRDPYAFGLGK